MFDLVKDAIIARKVEALQQDFRQAGQSLAQLISHLDSLENVAPETAWQLIHGLQAALQVAEKSLRAARQSDGLPPGPLRRAATDTLTAVSHLREVLERDVIPMAERQYGFPPSRSRWQVKQTDE